MNRNNMTPQQESVLEFHKKFGFDHPEKPTTPSKEIATLRINLLREELKELEEAFREKHLANIAHEMADVLYVTCGAAVTCGLELPLMPPLLPTREPNVPFRVTVNYHLKIIDWHITNLEEFFQEGIMEGIFRELKDIRFSLYCLAYRCGIDLGPVFAEVHRSNMTKEGGNKRADGKLLKSSSSYSPPKIQPLIDEMYSQFLL